MNSLVINDLSFAQMLDRLAMRAIRGAERVLRSSYVVTDGTGFGNYSLLSKTYQGQKFNDGYLSRHYVESWKRTRTQIEYSTWDNFVRV